MIGGDARGGVGLGFRRIADVGNAKVDVAAFVGGDHGGTVGQAHELAAEAVAGIAVGSVRAGGGIQGWIAARGSEDAVTVSVILAVDGMRRRGDLRLVKRNGNDFVAAEVADVADFDQEIAARLPLDVESLIHGVGKFVFAVVIGEGEER